MDNPFDVIMAELQEIKANVAAIPQPQAAPAAEIINTEELCRRLDITEPTAIKWRKRKKIPSFMIGSAVRYNWPEVVKFLETKCQVK